MILELSRLGHAGLHAVELPLTSLADDAERLRKMIAQQPGPVLLAGHSYGGAVITEAGNQPNVTGLVYIAAFAPDAGESAGGLTQQRPPAAAPHLAPDSDGYLWLRADKFHESFCQDLSADDALVMAAEGAAGLGLRHHGDPAGLARQTELVPDLQPGPHDHAREPDLDVRPPERAQGHHAGRQPRIARLARTRSSSADRRGGARLNSGAVALAPRMQRRRGSPGPAAPFFVLRPHYANCGKQAISPMKPSLVRYLRPN